MDAEADTEIEGARGKHVVDVQVGFTAFGVEHLWVIECKLWRRRVPKERVLVLQEVVDDVGADRGFLLSESGFQSGAVTAARLSNITLTNLEDLRANAEADIQGLRWDDLYSRLVDCKSRLDSLTVVTERGPGAGTSKLKPGVSSDEFLSSFGTTAFLDRGLERARTGRFPIAFGPDETGEGFAVHDDMDAYLDVATKAIEDLERWISEQEAKPWPNKPKPASYRPKYGEPGPTIVIVPNDDADGATNRETEI
jgi:Restriction endonuclease